VVGPARRYDKNSIAGLIWDDGTTILRFGKPRAESKAPSLQAKGGAARGGRAVTTETLAGTP